MHPNQKSSVKSILEHLEDLRMIIIGSLSIFLIACIAAACFFPKLANILNYPLIKASTTTASPHLVQGLVTTNPMGIFSILIDLCIFGGLGIALPFILYILARFIAPALTEKEKKILLPSCLAVLILFLIGSSFSYFYVLPASLEIAIDLNKTFGFQLIWSAPDYYGLVVWMTLGIGLCFEFPLVILLLIYLNVVSCQLLKQIRKYVLLVILILAAVITPTNDALSLAMLSIPMYILYELALLVGSRLEKYKAARELEENNQIDP